MKVIVNGHSGNENDKPSCKTTGLDDSQMSKSTMDIR